MGGDDGEKKVDNFADEVVDQADPEFKMADANGDGCISWEEARKPLDEQFDQNDEYHKTLSKSELEKDEEVHQDMLSDLKMIFENADKDDDGCINKEEFKA